MKTTHYLGLLAAPMLMLALAQPSLADTTDATVPTTCKDGTLSKAVGRGACSGHGGVNSKAAPTAPQSAGATPLSTPQGAPAAASGSGSTCKDGTASSASGRGACSGHGGVQKAAKAAPPISASAAPTAAVAPAPAAAPSAPAAAARAPAPTPPSAGTASTSSSTATAGAANASNATKKGSVNSDPTGATAKCKDGTFSHSANHTGSCSHHGGVANFLTPAPAQ